MCSLVKFEWVKMMTTTLSRRLTTHLMNWAIREHQIGIHHSNLTTEHIVHNTSWLFVCTKLPKKSYKKKKSLVNGRDTQHIS